MGNINTLLDALDERTIAMQIGIPNDEARMGYPLRHNTVADFDSGIKKLQSDSRTLLGYIDGPIYLNIQPK